MTIALADAVRATNAQAFDLPANAAPLRIVTDTRTIAPGDTFLALRGEHFDGHRFVAQARDAGATVAILADESARIPGMPTLVVADTLLAYEALATLARDALHGRVVAITGSAGKTTTKAFVEQVLRLCGVVAHATPENENNEIGVSKFFLARTDPDAISVVEMGARHTGDIATLVGIARPHVAVVTNVGDAHLGEMGSREAIAREKYSILARGAVPVVNAHDDAALARKTTLANAWWFATDPALVAEVANGVAIHTSHTLCVHRDGTAATYEIMLGIPGRHNRENLAAAVAVALALGIDARRVAGVLHDVRLPGGRFERIDLASGAALVYDAYNASPAGMHAALEAFAEIAATRRIAVLASMRELGPQAPLLHAEVGRAAAAAAPAFLFVGGDYATDLARGARDAGYPDERIVAYRDNADAAARLAALLVPGDVALLKGSRYYAMERIVEALHGVPTA